MILSKQINQRMDHHYLLLLQKPTRIIQKQQTETNKKTIQKEKLIKNKAKSTIKVR